MRRNFFSRSDKFFSRFSLLYRIKSNSISTVDQLLIFWRKYAYFIQIIMFLNHDVDEIVYVVFLNFQFWISRTRNSANANIFALQINNFFRHQFCKHICCYSIFSQNNQKNNFMFNEKWKHWIVAINVFANKFLWNFQNVDNMMK